ncbi:hypothetical protein A250_06319 [Pseudomonas syringae pv. actinidiae ICMP 9617]|nr:hypothetical protein A250_06319 [Pseudomonas syringae pv. actinidiae ICMP 9617]
MRGVDIWLPFVTSKIKQYKATDSKTPSSDAHPWISYMALQTTKGQSCEAMTYRKKQAFCNVQTSPNISVSQRKARLTAVWRLIKPLMKTST